MMVRLLLPLKHRHAKKAGTLHHWSLRAFVAACLLTLSTPASFGGEAVTAVISNPKVVLGPPTIKVHAAYFDLTNSGTEPVMIKGARSDGYERVEIHRSKISGGVAMMEPAAAVEIMPGTTTAFKPGGLHLMMIGPKHPQSPGATLRVVLLLASGKELTATFDVTSHAGMSPKTVGHGHNHGTPKHAH
jgi:copper(I)-binding protein